MAEYELRDPIHQRITFSAFERSIIDHPFLQRLRFISQLGFIQSSVYPGAVHDRFAHAIGAMHVAGRLFQHMIGCSGYFRERLTPQEREALASRVRLAGLLHDLGHGPFSHASESVFPPLATLPLDWSWWKTRTDRQAIHEDYSVLLIQTLAREGLFDEMFAQDLCALIHTDVRPSPSFVSLAETSPGLKPVLKGMISGEVDADRMDYLLRDSYYCGVAYGQYDLDWLISALSVAEHDGRLIVALSENGVRAYEDFLLARYHMIDQVYYHKTKAGFAHYLEEAIRQNEIDLTIPTDPYAYAQLRDGAVIERLFEAARDPANYWASHLIRRVPAKRILRLHADHPDDAQTLERLKAFCDEQRLGWFVHAVSNQLTNFDQGESERATMLYVCKQRVHGVEYVPIFQYSDLLQTYNKKLRFTDFFVLREDAHRFETVKHLFS
ncbi:HD domain-containing protein [Candidatus Parcubacteria bacterium]|nr:HD domain-containing protein [Candidatus Parcubacteria bacterium]